MAEQALKPEWSDAVDRLAEETELLQRALEIAKENPAILEQNRKIDIPGDLAVQALQRALDANAVRLAGLTIATLIEPESASDETNNGQ